MVGNTQNPDELTPEQQARFDSVIGTGEFYFNSRCSVNCLGCNADPCCLDMAMEAFEEGRQCQCAEASEQPQ